MSTSCWRYSSGIPKGRLYLMWWMSQESSFIMVSSYNCLICNRWFFLKEGAASGWVRICCYWRGYLCPRYYICKVSLISQWLHSKFEGGAEISPSAWQSLIGPCNKFLFFMLSLGIYEHFQVVTLINYQRIHLMSLVRGFQVGFFADLSAFTNN